MPKALECSSWGRLPPQRHTAMVSLRDRFQGLPQDVGGSMLPRGNARSYGDVCLNQDGALLQSRGMDRFISFDPDRGVLRCEAGVLLSDIIALSLPYGWFPAVTPGTALVSVGGAIANDVHGKNHHRFGCFSHHIRSFELARSDRAAFSCSPTQNADFFAATVGGLGLTGLITSAELQLRRVRGPWIRGDSQRFGDLKQFFALSSTSDQDFEYTVAWIDCVASGSKLGRGVFMRGNHCPETHRRPPKSRALGVPFTLPVSLVNRLSLRAFNTLYYHRPSAKIPDALWHYLPFLYPLDSISDWNRIYGPRGFFQYQCVVPFADAEASLSEMLKRIARSGVGSFLAVLKNFGHAQSQGIMSFARPGTTLALDFPNDGEKTLKLLDSLDEITRSAGGAVYPAKDARMSAADFQRYFPRWREFSAYIDPRFSSSFWRRVTGSGA